MYHWVIRRENRLIYLHQITDHAPDSITKKHYTLRPMDMLRMHMQCYED